MFSLVKNNWCITYPTKINVINNIEQKATGINFFVKTNNLKILASAEAKLLKMFAINAEEEFIYLRKNNEVTFGRKLSKKEIEYLLLNNINCCVNDKVRCANINLFNTHLINPKLLDILALYFIRKNISNILEQYTGSTLGAKELDTIISKLELFRARYNYTSTIMNMYDLEFTFRKEFGDILFEFTPLMSEPYSFHVNVLCGTISSPNIRGVYLDNFELNVEKYL